MAALRRLDISVAIRRSEPDRRVVLGEVMIPAPAMQDGDRVAKADLDGRIHFDGAYMTAPEIRKLCDRFASKRPAIDVEHSGQMIAAEVVESFLAGDGWEPWTAGAWVAGVKVHDDAVWQRIEAGELRAFSIQFIVRVREVRIQLVETLADGSDVERRVVLYEFSNADPQYLSLVGKPATGANWKAIDRTTVPVPFQSLPVAPAATTWDPVAAKARVDEWAAGDQERARQAHCYYDLAQGDGVQIADVIDGRLMVVRSRLETARELATSLPFDEDRGRVVNHLDTYLAACRTEEEPMDEPVLDAEETAPAVEPEPEIDDDETEAQEVPRGAAALAELRQLAQDDPDVLQSLLDSVDGAELNDGTTFDAQAEIDRAAEAAAAAVDDPPEPEVVLDDDGNPVAVGRSETPHDEPDTEDDPTPDPEAQNAVDGEKRTVLRTFLASIKKLLGLGDDEPAEDPEPEPVARATFNDLMAAQELDEGLWRGWMALQQTFAAVLAADDIDDKPSAMKLAIEDFARWAMGVVDKLGAADYGFLREEPTPEPAPSQPSVQDIFDGLAAEVERAGRKMAKKRLERLKAALAELNELLAELDPQDKDDDDRGCKPGHGSKKKRSEGDEPSLPVDQRLTAQLQQLVDENRDLQQRLRALEQARPAPAGGTDDGPSGGNRTPERIVAGVLFGHSKQ